MQPNPILEAARALKPRMSAFLRSMIALPSESTQEEAVIRLIRSEMEAVGFDHTEIDGMGNLIGRIGSGPRVIAFDAHIDTVGVGNRANWSFDPYRGMEDDEVIGGRGASDQEGGMAAMVFAGKLIKDLGLAADCTILMTATVQEEDCDGLCWQYLIKEHGLKPEFVVSTEPTSCRIYRGQRGRMEIKVATRGLSAHGSAPERGRNAIYAMGRILGELEQLNTRLADHAFLGKGTLAVSEIFFTSPSRCAVADGCWISVDRRLTVGETAESALAEIRALPAVKAAGATVEMYDYARASWTGLVYPTEAYFPTWLIDEDHCVTQAMAAGYRELFGAEPVVDKWTFSTNGVAIMGRHGIPCIGFGPGAEDQAHAPDEITWKEHLVKAAALYAALPGAYSRHMNRA
jgi:putative selenium metabolism hydrolase